MTRMYKRLSRRMEGQESTTGWHGERHLHGSVVEEWWSHFITHLLSPDVFSSLPPCAHSSLPLMCSLFPPHVLTPPPHVLILPPHTHMCSLLLCSWESTGQFVNIRFPRPISSKSTHWVEAVTLDFSPQWLQGTNSWATLFTVLVLIMQPSQPFLIAVFNSLLHAYYQVTSLLNSNSQ